MLTENRKLQLIFKIFSALCVVAIGVCLICDLAVNRRLGWSLHVLSAVPLLWLVASPLLIAKRFKIPCALALFTVALLPYLYVLEHLTPVRAWFTALGLPIAIIGLLALWATWLLLRFVKLNKWYLAAIIVFLYGVVGGGITNGLVNVFCGQPLFTVSNIINLISCAVITALLCVIGYGGKKESQ